MRSSASPILAGCFLILLALVTSAQIPAPAPSSTPAAKTLFLIRGPDGVVTPIRAVSFQQQGAVLLLVNERGGRAMVQARTVVGQLPWFTVEEVEGGAADPAELAAKYEAFASRVPSMRKFLFAEAAQFQAIRKRRDDEASVQKAAAEARVQGVTSAVYDPAADYSPETLDGLLNAADAVRSENPAAAERIDQWAAPFRDHLEKLKTGSRYLDGVWVTREELTKRARAEREAAFLKSLDAPRIAPVALPADFVHGLLTKLVLGALVTALAGAALIGLSRQRLLLRLAGVALFVGAPVTLAVLFFLATRDPHQLPISTGAPDLHPVLAALAEAAAVDDAAAAPEHTIPEAALNGFIARHLAIGPSEGDPWTATREALAIRFLPGRALVFELVRCLGRRWIVRYELLFRIDPGAAPVVVTGVSLGALECPDSLARTLWKNLAPQLVAGLDAFHVTEKFAVLGEGDGWIKLTSRSAVPNPAPATATAVTPAPSAPPPAATSPVPTPSPEDSPIQPGPSPRSEESSAIPTP